jgi:hypothetical protein
MTSSADFTLSREEYIQALCVLENAIAPKDFFEGLKPMSVETTNKMHRFISLVLDNTPPAEAIQIIQVSK